MKNKNDNQARKLNLQKRTIVKLNEAMMVRLAGGVTTNTAGQDGGSYGNLCPTMDPKDPKCAPPQTNQAATCPA